MTAQSEQELDRKKYYAELDEKQKRDNLDYLKKIAREGQPTIVQGNVFRFTALIPIDGKIKEKYEIALTSPDGKIKLENYNISQDYIEITTTSRTPTMLGVLIEGTTDATYLGSSREYLTNLDILVSNIKAAEEQQKAREKAA